MGVITFDLRKTLHSEGESFHLNMQGEIDSGTCVALYGESGSGKTTLLRLLSGLLQPDQGRLEVDGLSWFDDKKRIQLPVQQREIGFVFQDTALFPNMSVEQNLRYGLSKGQDPQILNELLEITELDALKTRMPHTLSGGQKQRVALARALVRKPKLLLLDEPFSALDHQAREQLQDLVLNVMQRYGPTIVLVSHEVSEVFRLAEMVWRVDDGCIAHCSPPGDFFAQQYGVSGKFQFVGKVVQIEPSDVVTIVTLVVGNQVTRVVADPSEASQLSVGDQVAVASKAFNPVLKKLESPSSSKGTQHT